MSLSRLVACNSSLLRPRVRPSTSFSSCSSFSTNSNSSSASSSGLTHVDSEGSRPKMVDISEKLPSARVARAQAKVLLPPSVLRAVRLVEGRLEVNSAKGPVLSTATVAGVMAAKRTSDLIPFCHPIPLDSCDIKFSLEEPAVLDSAGQQTSSGGAEGQAAGVLLVESTVKTINKTGVEMEALVSASAAALCVYDMLKALSHDIEITSVRLMEKTGGKSHFKRK